MLTKFEPFSLDWPKIYFKISTKLQLQNLYQTVANTFLIINISNTDYGRPLLVGWSMTSDNTSMNTDRNKITEAAMSWEWLFSICQEQEPDQFGSDCRKGYFWGEVPWTYLTRGSFNGGKPNQFDGSQDRLKLFFQSAIPSPLKIW